MSDSKSEVTLLENILPTTDAIVGSVSTLFPSLGITYGFMTLPIRYYLMTSSREEIENIKEFVKFLSGDIEDLQNKFHKWTNEIEQESLVKNILKSASKSKAMERHQAIANILKSISSQRLDNISYKDFFHYLDDLTDIELKILFKAYNLHNDKEHFELVKDKKVAGMPPVLSWTKLHEEIPNLSPEELLSVFDLL